MSIWTMEEREAINETIKYEGDLHLTIKGECLNMNTISFNVNNGRIIELVQSKHDGNISLIKYNSKGKKESEESILAGDFITMLNWYQYEKGNGNHNLDFK